MTGSTSCPICLQKVIIYDEGDQSTWLDESGYRHVHFQQSVKQGGLGTGTDEYLRGSDVPSN